MVDLVHRCVSVWLVFLECQPEHFLQDIGAWKITGLRVSPLGGGFEILCLLFKSMFLKCSCVNNVLNLQSIVYHVV